MDEAGQEGVELAFQQHLGGKPGSRRVIKDRLGQIVEDVESIRSAQDGRDLGPGEDIDLLVDDRDVTLVRRLLTPIRFGHAFDLYSKSAVKGKRAAAPDLREEPAQPVKLSASQRARLAKAR